MSDLPITDSQVHLWQADRPDRPWPTDRPESLTQRELPLEPSEMLATMDQAGVARAVIVPPIWAGDDNAAALEWVVQYPARLAIMGRFDLWSPTAETRLDTWLAQPGMLGIRMSYPRFRGYDWLDPETFPWFWAGAERLGIPIMLLMQGLPSRLAPIAQRHPGLTLILDHLGLRPSPQGESRTFAPLAEVLALARFENVYMKVSSMPVYSTEAYPYPRLAPYLRQVYDVFGPQRMMWGSDYSRLSNLPVQSTYMHSVDHVRQTLDFLSSTDKEWILGRTLEQAVHWAVGDDASLE